VSYSFIYTNETLNNDSSTIFNDEELGEQYDFDEWFDEQMDIHDNISEKSSGKEDNFVHSWTTSPAIV